MEKLVASRCFACPVPLRLNGRDVADDSGSGPAWGVAPIERAGLRGTAGFPARRDEPAHVLWLMDGVRIAEERLPDLPTGFVAVVDGGECLDLDVSQSAVVRNEAHAEALAVVRDALQDVWRSLAAEVERRQSIKGFPLGWAREVLRLSARSCASLADFRPGGRAEWLARVPLFLAVDLTFVSVEQLAASIDRGGTVGHSDCALPAMAVPRPPDFRAGDVVWLPWIVDPRDRALLFRLFGERLQPMTDRLRSLPRDPHLVEEIVYKQG